MPTYTIPVQGQNPIMGRGYGHEVPSLAEKLQTVDRYWVIEQSLSFKSIAPSRLAMLFMDSHIPKSIHIA